MQQEHEAGEAAFDTATAPTPRRARRGPLHPMGLGLAALLGILLAIFLLVDFNLSYDQSKTQAGNVMASSNGGGRPIGDQLQVYLSDEARLPGLQAALIAAVKAAELPFTDVTFVDVLPVDGRENPVLVVKILKDGGFWTPAYATRRMEARFYYTQGWNVDREAVLNPGDINRTVSVGTDAGDCLDNCARGERDLTLGARSVGLISLPHMRAYVAKEIAKEAVLLVKAGLPENLDPEKWFSRSGNLAREQGAFPGAAWSTFQRIPGCLGGVAFLGEATGPFGDWRMMYYDAPSDTLTETLTQAEFVKRAGDALGLSRLQGLGTPGFGGANGEFGLYVPTTGGGITATIPPGECGFKGLTFSR